VSDRREYLKEYRARNRDRLRAYFRKLADERQEFLDGIKRERGCADCGTREGRLDFDHRPGTDKKFIPSARKRSPIRVLMEEIDKCDVRCASCHTKRHWATDKRMEVKAS